MDDLKKIYNRNLGVIPEQPRQRDSRDFIAGEVTGVEYELRNAAYNWIPFYSPDEKQYYKYFDSMGCLSFSAENAVGIQINQFIDLDLLKEEIIQGELADWFNDDGYFDGSERGLAKMSNTQQYGNYRSTVADTIRTQGIIPQRLWPNEIAGKDFNWNEYYQEIPAKIKNLGKDVFLKYFSVYREWVTLTPSSIKKAMGHVPIQITSPICRPWNTTEIIQKCDLTKPTHATLITSDIQANNFFDHLDHYEPFRKRMARDYPISSAMKIIVVPKPEILKTMPTLYKIKGKSTLYHLGKGSGLYHPIAHEAYAKDLYGTWENIKIIELEELSNQMIGPMIGEYTWLVSLLSKFM